MLNGQRLVEIAVDPVTFESVFEFAADADPARGLYLE